MKDVVFITSAITSCVTAVIEQRSIEINFNLSFCERCCIHNFRDNVIRNKQMHVIDKTRDLWIFKHAPKWTFTRQYNSNNQRLLFPHSVRTSAIDNFGLRGSNELRKSDDKGSQLENFVMYGEFTSRGERYFTRNGKTEFVVGERRIGVCKIVSAALPYLFSSDVF